jgi:RimJ/RimL family protein N-acetyltransferase
MAKLNPLTLKTKAGLEITLRSAVPEDGAEIIEVVRQIFRSSAHLLTEESEFTMTPEQEGEFLKTYLEHPDRIYLVPVVEGRIAGMVNFIAGQRRRNSHQGKLGISILPQFQGRGVGRALMQTLMNWLADHPKVETVRLEVHARNEIAIKMYKSFGFHEEGREVRGVKFSDGTYDDTIVMARPVLPAMY